MGNKYINARDELPTENGQYLCFYGWYDDKGNYRGFERVVYYNYSDNIWAYRERPTHWMPLPSPPTEGLRDYREGV